MKKFPYDIVVRGIHTWRLLNAYWTGPEGTDHGWHVALNTDSGQYGVLRINSDEGFDWIVVDSENSARRFWQTALDMEIVK